MKNYLLLLAFLLSLQFPGQAQPEFDYPTDVVYNEAEEIYYVSNWADGEGNVLTMNTSGEITGTLFSDLSYAGGMCLIDDVLYVTDNGDLYGGTLPSYLVAIDINSGDELFRNEINSGGTYLDLIDTDNNGNIFICDSEKQCIYKYNIPAQTHETMVTGINKPLGICYDYIEDRVLFTQSKSAGSLIKSVSPEGGDVTNVLWHPGWIEGIIMNDEGEYFMSSWTGNGVDWGNEPVYKLNHVLNGWKYELTNDQNRPFGMCLGHNNFLVICNWGSHVVNFFDLTPYGTDEAMAQEETLNVYPNPGNGYLKVTVPANLSGHARLTVLDMSSRTVSEMVLQNAGGQQEIPLDLTFLPAGIYVLVVQDGNTLYREKLVIQ